MQDRIGFELNIILPELVITQMKGYTYIFLLYLSLSYCELVVVVVFSSGVPVFSLNDNPERKY